MVWDYALFCSCYLLGLQLGLTDLTTVVSKLGDYTAVVFLTDCWVTVDGHYWFAFTAFNFSFASLMIPANSLAWRLLCLHPIFEDLLLPNTSIQLLNLHLKIDLSLSLFRLLAFHSSWLLLVWMLTYMLYQVFSGDLFGKMLHFFSTLGVRFVFNCLLQVALNCN